MTPVRAVRTTVVTRMVNDALAVSRAPATGRATVLVPRTLTLPTSTNRVFLTTSSARRSAPKTLMMLSSPTFWSQSPPTRTIPTTFSATTPLRTLRPDPCLSAFLAPDLMVVLTLALTLALALALAPALLNFPLSSLEGLFYQISTSLATRSMRLSFRFYFLRIHISVFSSSCLSCLSCHVPFKVVIVFYGGNVFSA